MAPAPESQRDSADAGAPDARALAHGARGRIASCGITPVVLVGGRSRRFGRDKLREPVREGAGPGADAAADARWLVDRPLGALRAVFGPRVAAVGECDPRVAARFDRIIRDEHPGAGPIGGIVSALAAAEGEGGGVFVLAGDLGGITAAEVRAVLEVWWRHESALPAGCKPAPPAPPAGYKPAPPAGCRPAPPGLVAPLGQPGPVVAVMASTDRPEPCCGLYLPGALPILRARLERGQRSLHDAIPPENLALAPLPRQPLANVNAPADLNRLKGL